MNANETYGALNQGGHASLMKLGKVNLVGFSIKLITVMINTYTKLFRNLYVFTATGLIKSFKCSLYS